MNNPGHSEAFAWLAARLLSGRRIYALLIMLAVCFWGVAIVDFSTPGLLDRADNIKFQDFLPIYVAASMVHNGRANELYDQRAVASEMQAIAQPSAFVRLPYLYGPQVALFFSPLARFSFPTAARLWVSFSLVIYLACIYLVWSLCRFPGSSFKLCLLAAIAFPPLFHCLLRGQLSVLVLACFTGALLAFYRQHEWLAGAALGCLVFKPQFMVGILPVLLLAWAWKPLAGLFISATAQILVARFYFGSLPIGSYVNMLQHTSQWIGSAELGLAPIQMHSLRAFWTLLVPWEPAALVLYAISSIAVVATAAFVWKSLLPLALRFSGVTLAAVLVNPHLFVYDLLVLAPVLLLLAEWSGENTKHSHTHALQLLLYLAFVLPLLGPLSRWTHFQFSVLAFAALLALIARMGTAGQKLASGESRVV